jgi:hypothetical protein
MPNHLSFDVKITREEIEKILLSKDVKYLVVSGTSTYLGKDGWEAKTHVKGYSGDHKPINHDSVSGCIQPCP